MPTLVFDKSKLSSDPAAEVVSLNCATSLFKSINKSLAPEVESVNLKVGLALEISNSEPGEAVPIPTLPPPAMYILEVPVVVVVLVAVLKEIDVTTFIVDLPPPKVIDPLSEKTKP